MVTRSVNRSQARSHKASARTALQPASAQTAGSNGSSAAEAGTLRRLYASLLRCRAVQEHLRGLSSEQARSAEYDFAIGHEAVAVGVTAELRPEDTITASHRNLVARIARSAPDDGPRLYEKGDPVAWQPGTITATSLPEDPFNLGVGIALAHKLERKQRVVVAFCAQQKPGLEFWHDGLRFAAVHKLPVIFVTEQGITGDSPRDLAPHLEPVSFFARHHGFPGIIVDGQDVVAIWRVAQESIHRARNGSGPTLIDCRTDPLRDPLEHLEQYMRKRKLWDESCREECRRKTELSEVSGQAPPEVKPQSEI